ncbi:MAG: hypothetical protein ACI9WU_002666 [Myxococcota bacterium]|jgi:hypothetical protein
MPRLVFMMVFCLALPASAGDRAGEFKTLLKDARASMVDLGGAVSLYVLDTETGRSASENDCAARAALGFAGLPLIAVAMKLNARGKFLPTQQVTVTRAHAVGKKGLAAGRLPVEKPLIDLLVRVLRDGDPTAAAAVVKHIGKRRLAKAGTQLGLKRTRLDKNTPGGLATSTADIGHALLAILRMSKKERPEWKPVTRLFKPLKKRVLASSVPTDVRANEFEGGRATSSAYRVAVLRKGPAWLMVIASYPRLLDAGATRKALNNLAGGLGAYMATVPTPKN